VRACVCVCVCVCVHLSLNIHTIYMYVSECTYITRMPNDEDAYLITYSWIVV
jgi:hypothetical protein